MAETMAVSASLKESIATVDADAASIKEALRVALRKNAVKIMDLFVEWDENGDHKVSKSEFRRAMAGLGFKHSRPHIDAVFDSFDEDSSGHIDCARTLPQRFCVSLPRACLVVFGLHEIPPIAIVDKLLCLPRVFVPPIDKELNRGLKRLGNSGGAASGPGPSSSSACSSNVRVNIATQMVHGAGAGGGMTAPPNGSPEALLQQKLREALAANAARVIDLFKEWDEDKDGVVSQKEFARAVRHQPALALPSRHALYVQMATSLHTPSSQRLGRLSPACPSQLPLLGLEVDKKSADMLFRSFDIGASLSEQWNTALS